MSPYVDLAADLRDRSDAELGALFTARPDLLVPVPPNIPTLASRALTRWSVSSALTQIDLWTGELAQALVALPTGTSYDELVAAFDAEPADVRRGLDRLRSLGLVWGPPDALFAAPALDGLLAGVIAKPAHPSPPVPRTRPAPTATVDRAAADAAATVVRLAEALLEEWGAQPPAVLKTGGLGVRELRRAATLLDVPPATAALVAESAYAAGLLSFTDDYAAEWLPTARYDGWRDEPIGQRWAAVAGAWLRIPRAPGRALQRDDRGKARVALGPDLVEPLEPGTRRAVLTALAGLPAGTAAESVHDAAAIVQWQRPLAFALDLALDAWTHAELLGITAQGALSSGGRALLAGDDGAAAAAVTPHLPALLDSVLLQADLTAVAPGPLEPALARELRLLAEVESTGGATVYRFGPESLRRAFDAGRSAAEIHTLLSTRSRTPVPQPLSYLVDDVSRRHGRIRVGAAAAFLRSDDEALLGEVLAHRRTVSLRLRRLAPTVLAAQAPTATVLEVLRGAGFAPVPESATGDVVVERAAARRTPSPRQPPRRLAPVAPRQELVTAAVRAVRAGDRAARHRPARTGAVTDPMTTLQLLREAARDGRALWIDYLNASGVASQRIIEPMYVDGGHVTAYDHRRGERRNFAAHRITNVAPVGEDEA